MTSAPTWATATYTAPAGSVIAGGSINGVNILQNAAPGGSLNDVDAWISTPADAPDTADAVLNCEGGASIGLSNNFSSCSWPPGGAQPPDTVTLPDRGGTQLFITAACSIANTDPCDSVNSAGVMWDWADILLADNSPPTAAAFGGSLIAPGSVHGTAALTFTATDPNGPGVYNVAIKIDGNPIYSGMPSTNGGECQSVGTDPSSGAMMFDHQQPCPTSEQLDLSVDTTQLSDGTHRLQVTVEDAAQNVAAVLDQMFTTQNLTTVASTTAESPITTTSTAPAATTPVATTPAAAPPSPVASAPVVLALKLDPLSAKLAGAVLRRHYLGSKVLLSGIVVDAAGAPVPGAQVSARVGRLSGKGLRTVAQTTTDGAGRFKLLVRRGDSREVQLVAGGQTVSFKQFVRPNVSLKVASLRGQQLVFTGRIAINRNGGPRPIVELSDRGTAGWQALANVQVNKHGRYRYVYRASRLAIGRTFKIRASTAASTFWQSASSHTLKVKVI